MYNILSLVHKTAPVKRVNVVSCPTMCVNAVSCPKNATITRLYLHDYMRVSPHVFQVINEPYRRYAALSVMLCVMRLYTCYVLVVQSRVCFTKTYVYA